MRITLRELRRIIRETIEDVAMEGDMLEGERDREAEKGELALRKRFNDLGMDMDTRGKAVRDAVAQRKKGEEDLDAAVAANDGKIPASFLRKPRDR